MVPEHDPFVDVPIGCTVAVGEVRTHAIDVPMTIDELFSTHATYVWRTLRQFGVAEADLEDQTQEVFLIALRRLAEAEVENERGWLWEIARRCAAAYRRRSHRRHEEPVETLPEGVDLRDPSVRAEFERLNRIVDSLDEDKQAVFFLYEIEGMSMREVAEVLRCPLKTAYKRLYAARRELTRAIGEEK